MKRIVFSIFFIQAFCKNYYFSNMAVLVPIHWQQKRGIFCRAVGEQFQAITSGSRLFTGGFWSSLSFLDENTESSDLPSQLGWFQILLRGLLDHRSERCRPYHAPICSVAHTQNQSMWIPSRPACLLAALIEAGRTWFVNCQVPESSIPV